MRVRDIFSNLDLDSRTAGLKIKDISDDSRLLRKGDMFFIRERKNFDIFSILSNAEKKAAVFVGAIKNKSKILSKIQHKPIVFVDDVDRVFYSAVNKFYGFDKSDFTFIGVTGTNGKTTTTHLIYHLLKKLGKKVALIGTVNYIVGDKTYKADFTTPNFLILRKIFNKAKKHGCKFIVMEVSSHGIDQGRIDDIDFSRCIFTNLSRDHLDYHKTMKNYFTAKMKLFKNSKNALFIINKDDFYGRKILSRSRNHLSYGITRQSDFTASDIRFTKDGSYFSLKRHSGYLQTKTALLGKHNVLNILAAIATLDSLGFSFKKVINFVSTFKGVDGRLERVASDVFIDYAHTPDALSNILFTLRESGHKRIVCVFGCGGQRDKGKRKIMGKIASSLADFSFITADNPRNEDLNKICKQIEGGFEKNNYFIALDRKEAIKKALLFKKRHKECCVIIAGKGHEDYQIIGDKKIPFKDKDVIKELMVCKKC